jgi:hypothetical protein
VASCKSPAVFEIVIPLSPNYYKVHFPIQLNWSGADAILLKGYSVGPPGRISPESGCRGASSFTNQSKESRYLGLTIFFRL